MQYLAQIVNGMNGSIQKILIDERFKGSIYHGIAVLAADGDQVRPLVTDHYDKNIFISPDDRIPVTIYHRTLQITRVPEAKKRYGSDAGVIKETASMCLIAYGSRNMIKLTPEELESAIASGIPSIIAASTRTTMKLSSCEIQLSTSIIDPVQVYLQETKSNQFDLPPNSLAIRINYNILSSYNTNCFNLCDC